MLKIKLTIAAGMMTATAQHAQAQTVIFYEENACRKEIFRVTDNALLYCTTRHTVCSGKNDAAQSMRVMKPAGIGVFVIVHDSPYKAHDDEFESNFMATGKPGAPDVDICIPTFERTTKGPLYWTKYDRVNGLDGKVSYIQVMIERYDKHN